MHQEEEKIEKYLHGQLEGRDLEAFLQQLSEDKAFREKVEDFKFLYQGMEKLGRQAALLEEAEAIEASLKPPTLPLKAKLYPRRWLRRLAAAAAILLLVFFGLQWYATAHFSNEALAESAYRKPATPNNLRNLNGQASPLSEGLRAFRDADFETARQSLDEELSSQGKNNMARYYFAHSLFQLEDFQAATRQFALVEASGDLRYAQAAQFYRLFVPACRRCP